MRLLRRIARSVLGPEKASAVWSRIDIVGDIALIKSPWVAGLDDPLTLEEYRRLAEALLVEVPYIKSVWLLRGPVRGSLLLREAIHLAGERRSTTIYKEHGCEFKIDILKVFVTPRLNYEHRRVAELVKPGEVIVNMFAGAGLFSIIIACRKPVRVYSIDLNPDAYKYMIESIELNRRKLKGEVIPILGDAARVIEERLKASADRVLEPYPRLALGYMEYALEALKNKGWLHVYLHVEARGKLDARSKAEKLVRERIRSLGWDATSTSSRIVRPVGPRLYQVVVDVEVDKKH
jgi:tRNA (guanine37-N1)-methyltransferase